MKKFYLFALAALTLSACSNNGIVEEIEEVESAITFRQFTEKATKAEIADEAALAAAGGFKVWGYKAKTEGLDWATSAKTQIFTAQVVTYASSDSEWSYTPAKYWDKTSTYKFFAAGPVGHTNGTLDLASGDLFTVTGAQYAKAAESLSDFVIDREVNIEDGANHTGSSNPRVGFDFHHIMAKLSFIVKLQDGFEGELTVNSLKMSGWNAGSGDFAQMIIASADASGDTWNSLNHSEWTIATAASGDVALVSGDATDAAFTLTASSDATKKKELTDAYIMVPQTVASGDLCFTVDYEIDGEQFTAQVGFVPGDQIWGTDSHTTYTILVGPNPILFDVNSVCDFCLKASGTATIE